MDHAAEAERILRRLGQMWNGAGPTDAPIRAAMAQAHATLALREALMRKDKAVQLADAAVSMAGTGEPTFKPRRSKRTRMAAHQMTTDPARFLTPKQFMERVKLSRTTVYEGIRDGSIPSVTISRRKILIPEDALERQLAGTVKG